MIYRMLGRKKKKKLGWWGEGRSDRLMPQATLWKNDIGESRRIGGEGPWNGENCMFFFYFKLDSKQCGMISNLQSFIWHRKIMTAPNCSLVVPKARYVLAANWT